MDIDDVKIQEAVEHTEILRAAETEPDHFRHDQYLLLSRHRTGVRGADSERPVKPSSGKAASSPKNRRIVTPYYLSSLEGFSENARRYFDSLVKTYGTSVQGLLYAYRNEPERNEYRFG